MGTLLLRVCCTVYLIPPIFNCTWIHWWILWSTVIKLFWLTSKMKYSPEIVCSIEQKLSVIFNNWPLDNRNIKAIFLIFLIRLFTFSRKFVLHFSVLHIFRGVTLNENITWPFAIFVEHSSIILIEQHYHRWLFNYILDLLDLSTFLECRWWNYFTRHIFKTNYTSFFYKLERYKTKQ